MTWLYKCASLESFKVILFVVVISVLQLLAHPQDLIQGTMNAEAVQHLKKLSQQGAAHYQAEEDFMNLPVLCRSKSAPTSSLAVRYERLRGPPSKVLFQRQSESQPSTQPEASETMTSSAAPLSPLARCATAPQMRMPTRIVVRPAMGADQTSETDAIKVPDVMDAVRLHPDEERPADFEVPEEARARHGKKRGSDPAVLYVPEVKKLRKKKKKGFFRRHRDSYGADSGASGGDSDATTHSTHSSVSEPANMGELRPRSWTRRMTDYMTTILRKR